MAVPSDPTIEQLILGGMREGGRYSVTSAQQAYTDFVSYQWPGIKTELWNACRTDRLLEKEALLVAEAGYHPLTLPSDFDNEISLWVFDADAPLRGTAQGGTTTTITLAADVSVSEEELLGRYVFTLDGTGSGQFRQIRAYNESTKVATVAVDTTWTAPDNTTKYVIGYHKFELIRSDYARMATTAQRPRFYSRVGTSLQVFPAPDEQYPVVLAYRANLTRIDETDSVFIKHIRERRHLWHQGVKTATMARYDDERYEQNKMIWERMLAQYAAQNVVYTQMLPHR